MHAKSAVPFVFFGTPCQSFIFRLAAGETAVRKRRRRRLRFMIAALACCGTRLVLKKGVEIEREVS